jgi:phage shock protein A
MGWSLTERVNRLVSGSINTTFDRIENAVPEVFLAELIREMKQARRDARAELGQSLADAHNAAKGIERTRVEQLDLRKKLDLAIEESRDDLAVNVIGRQIDLEAQLPVLKDSLAEAAAKESEFTRVIQVLDATIRDREDELATLDALSSTDSRQRPEIEAASIGVKGRITADFEEANDDFREILRRRTGYSVLPHDLESAANMQELGEMQRGRQIYERLEAAKQKRQPE